MLDDFLPAALFDKLSSDFPSFDPALSISENGVPGGKMVRSDLSEVSPAFRALDQVLRGEEFLRLVGAVTGIEGLLFDPSYFGGGLHLSLPGQELDPHLDFNMHPARNWRRRVNVLLYLNTGWKDENGGSLELHSDPRDPSANQMAIIAPLANRLVIFETNESSWHGHGPVADSPRRSITAYYYSEARIEDTAAPAHYTVYVDRPLVGTESRAGLSQAFAKRKAHLQRRLKLEKELLQTVARLNDRATEYGAALAESADLELIRGQISGLDCEVANTYEREKSLQAMIDRLSDEVEALKFLSDESGSSQERH